MPLQRGSYHSVTVVGRIENSKSEVRNPKQLRQQIASTRKLSVSSNLQGGMFEMAPVPEILFRSFSPFINSNFELRIFQSWISANTTLGRVPSLPRRPLANAFGVASAKAGGFPQGGMRLFCERSIESHGTAKNPTRRLRVEFRGMARKLLSGGLAAKPLVGILFALFSGS